MKDQINPDHYKQGKVETIDYMEGVATLEEFLGHCRLTALKYLSRAGRKLQHEDQHPAEAMLRDLKKAAWYVNKAAEVLEDRQDEWQQMEMHF